MRIAICAPFMQSDIWQERLRKAASGCRLEFDEFYNEEDIRGAVRFRYDVCVIAMAGAAGMEAAVAARERDAHLPILWISDDDHFGLAAYDLQAAMFLNLDCSDGELAEAMDRCGVGEKEDRHDRIAM